MKKISASKLALALSVILVSSGYSTFSSAQSYVVNSNSMVTTNGKLLQIGIPISSALLTGVSENLPLLKVLHQITPVGWVVKKNESSGQNVEVNKTVLLNKNQSWVEALNYIAQNNNYIILINWNSKTITISQASTMSSVTSVKTTKKEALFELDNSPVTIQKEQYKPVVVKPLAPVVVVVSQTVAPIVVAKPTWQLKEGSSLKTNVIEMGKRAGYKVIWLAKDYPVDDDRTLVGEFDAEDGPIKQLSIDYSPDSRVQQPLSFVFFEDKKLVVENLKYEQSGTPQYIKRNN